MTASVGDFVTAVLLAELAADDELVSIEETSHRNNMLQEIYKRRRETRQLVWSQVSHMLPSAAKKAKTDEIRQQDEGEGQKTIKHIMEPIATSTTNKKPKKKKKATKVVKKEKNSEPDSTESVPAPFLTFSEFSEFQSYFGIKQPAFEKIVLGVAQQPENENKSS